jgi:hypothetical protein
LRSVRPTHRKVDFLISLSEALGSQAGFAAGKLGISEGTYLSHNAIRPQLKNEQQHKAFDLLLRVHASRQSGIFPETVEFIQQFADNYLESFKNLDYLAVQGNPLQYSLVNTLEPHVRSIPFDDLEPDRSVPYNPNECWLPLLNGKHVLIISSIASLLAERAEASLFESVWKKVGIPWFNPASVESLDFPQIYDRETRALYPTVNDLLENIMSQIDAREFDIALIAGAGIGVPIAAHIKRKGRTAISLGGHLQILFGVQGKRWLDSPEWQEKYVTGAWMKTPEWARPSTEIGLTDDGAYW